mgnify:CR=1 FL=1
MLKESAVESGLLSEELYESREMFKALVEFTEAIHLSVDLETGRFTNVSPQAGKITGYSSEEVRRYFQERQNRIHAMSLVHERLYKDDTLEEADMKEYINSLISFLYSTIASERVIRFETDIEPVRFGLDTVIPCELILNELVTNSLKHAFPEGKGGKIRITLHTVPGSGLEITVADNGRGLLED